jgi:hypothetical protein
MLYEGLHVLAGLAQKLGTRKGFDLARFLHTPLSRPAAREALGDKPVGRLPSVYLSEAEGVRLKVIATLAS